MHTCTRTHDPVVMSNLAANRKCNEQYMSSQMVCARSYGENDAETPAKQTNRATRRNTRHEKEQGLFYMCLASFACAMGRRSSATTRADLTCKHKSGNATTTPSFHL